MYSINEGVFHKIKEGRNILHTVMKRKAKWMVTSCAITAFYNRLLKER
jgi:hypothetical protein